jgi:predicted DNA-binding transcriptional regulator AlpA
MSILDEELLADPEAAAVIGVVPTTMPQWRHRGVGPRYLKLGRLVRYRPSDLRDWINQQVVDPTRKIASA